VPDEAKMSSLTVIPAIFKDSERALAAVVEAKRSFDTAMANLRERDRAKAKQRALQPFIVRNAEGVDTEYQRDQATLEPLVVEVERARAEYEVAFTIYQEAARSRDAATSNKLAESNNATAAASKNAANRVATVTIVLAVVAVFQTAAAVGQIVHTWSK
jgi:hypothetical protein